MPCPQRRRIPSIIRAVSPCFTPPCIARRRRERSRPPMPPPTPYAATISPLTRPPIHPTQRKFPLPVRRAESVTVRRAMPADHHEALPSLLYLCGGLRPGRFMWCLHSVSCRSFFLLHPPTRSVSSTYIFLLKLLCESRRPRYVTNLYHNYRLNRIKCYLNARHYLN